jgi:hypothetical protein
MSRGGYKKAKRAESGAPGPALRRTPAQIANDYANMFIKLVWIGFGALVAVKARFFANLLEWRQTFRPLFAVAAFACTAVFAGEFAYLNYWLWRKHGVRVNEGNWQKTAPNSVRISGAAGVLAFFAWLVAISKAYGWWAVPMMGLWAMSTVSLLSFL